MCNVGTRTMCNRVAAMYNRKGIASEEYVKYISRKEYLIRHVVVIDFIIFCHVIV